MNFFSKPGISVRVINPQKCSGLFSMPAKIMDADTVADVISRMSKDSKHIKSTRSLIFKSFNIICITQTTFLLLFQIHRQYLYTVTMIPFWVLEENQSSMIFLKIKLRFPLIPYLTLT